MHKISAILFSSLLLVIFQLSVFHSGIVQSKYVSKDYSNKHGTEYGLEPFGLPISSRSISTNRGWRQNLRARVDVPSFWTEATRKGKGALCRFGQSGEQNQFQGDVEMTALNRWGWNGLSIPSTSSSNKAVWAKQDEAWESPGHPGKTEPTAANYLATYNVNTGLIVAQYSESVAGVGRTTGLVPDLQHWSDVIFLIWFSQCNGDENLVKGIKTIIRYHIENDQTENVIRHIVGDNIQAYEEAEAFSTGTDKGEAILGTPHGQGVAFFLIQHQEKLGRKKVDSVKIFSTQTSVGQTKNLMFSLSDM